MHPKLLHNDDDDDDDGDEDVDDNDDCDNDKLQIADKSRAKLVTLSMFIFCHPASGKK